MEEWRRGARSSGLAPTTARGRWMRRMQRKKRNLLLLLLPRQQLPGSAPGALCKKTIEKESTGVCSFCFLFPFCFTIQVFSRAEFFLLNVFLLFPEFPLLYSSFFTALCSWQQHPAARGRPRGGSKTSTAGGPRSRLRDSEQGQEQLPPLPSLPLLLRCPRLAASAEAAAAAAAAAAAPRGRARALPRGPPSPPPSARGDAKQQEERDSRSYLLPPPLPLPLLASPRRSQPPRRPLRGCRRRRPSFLLHFPRPLLLPPRRPPSPASSQRERSRSRRRPGPPATSGAS